jgi:hypothetical protein
MGELELFHVVQVVFTLSAAFGLIWGINRVITKLEEEHKR